MATTAAPHQFSGRRAAHNGRSIRSSTWGAVYPARTAPRSSTRSAREPPVPMSIPSHIDSYSGTRRYYDLLNIDQINIDPINMALISVSPKFRPVLDPDFVPASLWNRA